MLKWWMHHSTGRTASKGNSIVVAEQRICLLPDAIGLLRFPAVVRRTEVRWSARPIITVENWFWRARYVGKRGTGDHLCMRERSYLCMFGLMAPTIKRVT